MKLFDFIKNKKNPSLDELVQPGRDLQAKLKELDQEEKDLNTEAKELQIKSISSGRSSEKLKEIQLKQLDIPQRREAITELLNKVKTDILDLIPKERLKEIKKIDEQIRSFEQMRKDALPLLLENLGRTAVLLELAIGTTRADNWKKHLLSGDILESMREVVTNHWDRFQVELKKAKEAVPGYKEAGDLRGKMVFLKNTKAILTTRNFDLEDADEIITTGRLPPAPKPLVPIHPHWPEGKPLIREESPVAR